MNRVLLLLPILLLACRTEGSSEPPDDAGGTEEGQLPTEYPGTLVEIGKVSRDFMMRQKLSGSWQDMKFSFEAVVQKQGDKLTVLGLTPFGTKAFSLVQTGTEVEFEKYVDREMPFPPEYILQDIHRVFLYDVELPWGLTGEDGLNEATVHDELVHEEFVDGRLVSRRFARSSGYPEGEIRVDYEGGTADGVPAKNVSFSNGWFGYRLEIKTTLYQPM